MNHLQVSQTFTSWSENKLLFYQVSSRMREHPVSILFFILKVDIQIDIQLEDAVFFHIKGGGNF